MGEIEYNLEERLAKLAEETIRLARTIKITPINHRIIDQLIGAVGSSGANYCEATEAESRKDFIHKVGLVKKELKEANHWFRLLIEANPENTQVIKMLSQETHELLLIFAKISRSSRNKVSEN